MFNTDDFINLSYVMYKDRKFHNQSGIRTAISRPYVATLSNAKAKLEEKNVKFPENKELHKSIVEELKNYDNKLSDKLDRLNDFRFKADFDLTYTPDKELIPFVASIAKSFSNLAKKKLK